MPDPNPAGARIPPRRRREYKQAIIAGLFANPNIGRAFPNMDREGLLDPERGPAEIGAMAEAMVLEDQLAGMDDDD